MDLAGYRLTLMIFLAAGGAIAMLNLFVSLLTAMRKQKSLLFAYAAASLVLLLAGRPLFTAKGINALCFFYLAVLLGVLGWCAGVYLATLRKRERQAAGPLPPFSGHGSDPGGKPCRPNDQNKGNDGV